MAFACSVQVDLCSVQGERDRQLVLIGSYWFEVLGSRFGIVAKATSGDSFGWHRKTTQRLLPTPEYLYLTPTLSQSQTGKVASWKIRRTTSVC